MAAPGKQPLSDQQKAALRDSTSPAVQLQVTCVCGVRVPIVVQLVVSVPGAAAPVASRLNIDDSAMVTHVQNDHPELLQASPAVA